MNFLKRVSIITLIFVLTVSVLAFAAEPVKVTILHTNDTHGRIASFTPRGEEKEIGGFARILTLINKIRAEEENVILLDAGDTLHGTNLVNLQKGLNMLTLLNTMGYDAMVPGNHDFNYGYKHLLKLAKFAKFDIVSANVEKDGALLFAPYTILEKGGYRFAILGISTPETPITTHPANVAGLNFVDPIQRVKEIVEKLSGSVDFIIMLSHLGYEGDRMIAEQVPGLDIIIGGHSHTSLEEPVVVNGVIIAQDGDYGRTLGRIDLTIEDGKIIKYSGRLIPVKDTIAKNPVVDVVVKAYEDKLRTLMGEVVGTTSVDLVGERALVRTQETNLGNLITDIMLAYCDADLVMTNGGGIRASIAKGDITIGDIYTVLPFDNTLVVLELTGAQIKAALEHGVRKYPKQNGGFLHVAGMTYAFDPNRPAGDRIVEVKIRGKDLDLNKIYRVATNDFLAAGGDGYSMFTEGTIVYQSGSYLRDLMVDYLREHGSVSPEVEGRITIR
ncbi:hypothetical protein BBF96_01025 [Anoxybacter fermentans]|uniref:Multifunctional 2',3'-cyclic-nucleotide 2'-phosphodiesterase/5'-nucleotidase/3'-nucleotidase n=1 Tax=Anoxybacter fermentans TaxID=1323375 RepID=A0A3Q9HNJ7_9FIRM|nr:5'-nucleotidase C-terminal domain-containing protein [Anoxybacter fermentans]AZR72096.1 hypothetical protein BBF96_01025 [Anoxybacter fermentans]